MKQLNSGKRDSSGQRPDERPAGEAKPNVCAISDGKAGAYCTVGLVKIILNGKISDIVKLEPTEAKTT